MERIRREHRFLMSSLNLALKFDLTLFKNLAWISRREKHGSKHVSIASKGSHKKTYTTDAKLQTNELQKQLNILSKKEFCG